MGALSVSVPPLPCARRATAMLGPLPALYTAFSPPAPRHVPPVKTTVLGSAPAAAATVTRSVSPSGVEPSSAAPHHGSVSDKSAVAGDVG